jgi:multiple sugar transport system permease protein
MLTKFDTPFLFSGSTVNRAGHVFSLAIFQERNGALVDSSARAAVLAVVLGIGVGLLVAVLAACKWLVRVGLRRGGELISDLLTAEIELRRHLRPLGGPLGVMCASGLGAFALAPVIALLCGSLVPETALSRGLEISSTARITGAHYASVFEDAHRYFGRLAANTFLLSAAVVAGTVFVSLIGAFAITRRWNAVGRAIDVALIAGYLIPPVALTIAYQSWARQFGLQGSRLAELIVLAIANIGLCLPYALWLMTSYVDRLQREYDMTAAMDGASWGYRLQRVIWPLAMPGIIGVSVSVFVLSWNDIAFAWVLAAGGSKPLAAGLFELLCNDGGTALGDYAAASICASLVALILCAAGYWIFLRSYRPAQAIDARE